MVILWLIALAGLTLSAQTVKPVIVQYAGSAKGKIELVNTTLRPLNVVLEPMSFTIDVDGNGIYMPLARETHLKLSSTSYRIPPRQSRFVFYEATPETLPSWFVIYSAFSGSVKQSGVNVRVQIPHTVYVLQKQHLEKQDVAVESFQYFADQHRVSILLANRSPKLGRVVEWQVSSKDNKAVNTGFPLLPQGHRRLEIEWRSPQPPDVFSVHFEHFTLQKSLHDSQ